MCITYIVLTLMSYILVTVLYSQLFPALTMREVYKVSMAHARLSHQLHLTDKNFIRLREL